MPGLGVLATVAPSSEELIYCYHERGFALLSMRSPTVSRLYLQVGADERIDDWSDSRIWDELQTRFAQDGWTLQEGPITEKAISALRSFVVEPMQFGRLYLCGDAAHIVPPTGAKGMNLALRDVSVLSEALTAFYRDGATALLDAYSARCLRRVWRAQHFSWWMTSMLHRFPDNDAYQVQLQLAQLDYTVNSRAASTSLAENYVGYEWTAVVTEQRAAAAELTQQAVDSLQACPDPRLRELLGNLIRTLHRFAVENSLTEAEWFAAVRFLTEVGQTSDDRRQEFILLSDTLGLSMMVDLVNHATGGGATESTVLGPFYVPDSPWRENGDAITDDLGVAAAARDRSCSRHARPAAGGCSRRRVAERGEPSLRGAGRAAVTREPPRPILHRRGRRLRVSHRSPRRLPDPR